MLSRLIILAAAGLVLVPLASAQQKTTAEGKTTVSCSDAVAAENTGMCATFKVYFGDLSRGSGIPIAFYPSTIELLEPSEYLTRVTALKKQMDPDASPCPGSGTFDDMADAIADCNLTHFSTYNPPFDDSTLQTFLGNNISFVRTNPAHAYFDTILISTDEFRGSDGARTPI